MLWSSPVCSKNCKGSVAQYFQILFVQILLYNKSEEIKPISSDFSIYHASYEFCGNGGENKMSSLLFLGLLAFDSGFAAFMGCLFFLAFILVVIRLFFYVIYQIMRLIWKSLPSSWLEAVINYMQERENKVARGETCIPPFVSYKKLFLSFITAIVFGGAGLIFSLLVIFLLIPFNLPDPVLKVIWIVTATVLSVSFSIRSVHYSWPEYENWVKKKYFSKKQKGQRGSGINTEEKAIIQNHMIAVVGKPIDCREEKFCPVSSIRPKRKFHFGIVEIMVKLGVACVFAAGGVIAAILCTFVFALFGATNDTLVSITRILLCLLPTVMFFWSFKCT